VNERVTRIVRNYEARMRLDWDGKLTKLQICSRVQRFAAAVEVEDIALRQTQQVFAVHDVPKMGRCYYHSFARELGRLHRRGFGPATERNEARILVMKWQARGLEQSVLVAIAEEAFGLCLSAAPDGEEVVRSRS